MGIIHSLGYRYVYYQQYTPVSLPNDIFVYLEQFLSPVTIYMMRQTCTTLHTIYTINFDRRTMVGEIGSCGYLNVYRMLRLSIALTSFCALAAAEYGKIEILQELPNLKYHLCLDYRAVAGNQLAVLKWLVSQGYLYDKNMLMEIAIRKGHLDIIVYLTLRGYTYTDMERMLESVVQYGHLHVIKHFCPPRCNKFIISRVNNIAAKYGQMEILEYLASIGYCYNGLYAYIVILTK